MFEVLRLGPEVTVCALKVGPSGMRGLVTIPAEIITDLTWCRFIVFELTQNCNDSNSMRF